MTVLSVLGMDPSLNNWGMAHGTYHVETGELKIRDASVIQPERLQGKQVRNNSKDLHRAKQLAHAAVQACNQVSAVFVEVPHGSQSARAMASYGVCVGVLGSVAAQGIPFYEITPTEVKLAMAGKKSAGKDQIIERAVTDYPMAGWPYYMKHGQQHLTLDKAEHMADAIGAIQAGIQQQGFQQLVHTLQTLSHPVT